MYILSLFVAHIFRLFTALALGLLAPCLLPSLLGATGARVNLAKYQSATASVQASSYAPDFAVDGIVSNFHSYRTGNTSGPTWLEISYPRPVTLASAHLYSGLLVNENPTQVYTNFRFQYHDGTVWIDIPGATVSANTAPERNVAFTAPVTAERFRLYSTDSGNRAVRQLAFFPPNVVNAIEQGHPLGTDVSLNLAHKHPATASTASINNSYGPGYAKNAFDGYLDNLSRWVATTAAAGEYLEIDLLDSHRLATAHVYSGFIDPANPTRTTTQPIPDFTLQYWDGAAWLPIPGAEITGNTAVALAIEFSAAVTTSKVRLVTSSAFNGRIQELLLFPPRDGGTPVGREVIDAPPPARTWDTYSDSNYRLRNNGPDQRLGLINDQVVQVTPSTANAPFIEWQLLLNHRDGSYRLRHPETGLALALAEISLAADTAVVAESYSGLPHQDWLLDFDPAVPTRFRLLNRYSGLALQTLNGSTASGVTMVVRPAVAGLNLQYWTANYQRHHPKKGIAATGNMIRTSQNPYVTDSDLTFIEDFYNRLRGSWSYTWGRQTSDVFPFMDFRHTFNPMQWGNFNWVHNTNQGPIERIHRDLQASGQPVHLMAFNEPEKESQGFITVDNALARWPRLEARDAPLVSPAPAGTFNGWQADFTAQANALGYRRDYTAVHWYAEPNADALISHLQQAHVQFGRPIWLTEFSTARWSGTATWTDADNYNFLAEFMWRAESLPWLKRYSLFAFIQGPTDNPNQGAPDPAEAPRSNALRADGTLTPFGELYAAWDGVTTVLPDRAYHLHNRRHYRRAQNPGPGTTDTVTSISPEVAASGHQWFLIPGATENTVRLVSTLDGRRLRYWNGTYVGLAAATNTATQTEWRLMPDQHGWFFLAHPQTGTRLRMDANGSLLHGSGTGTTDEFKWRFAPPSLPDPVSPPAAPASPSTALTLSQITLAWPPVSTALTYSVRRASSADGPWQTVASHLNELSFTDTDLQTDTTYFYQILAENTLGVSSPSSPVSAILLHPNAQFSTWADTFLPHLPLGDRAPTADPFHTGLPNLLAYAFGRDPSQPGPHPLSFSPPNSPDSLSFEFPWNWRASTLTWRIRHGTDLTQPTTWPVVQAASTEVSHENDIDRIRLTFPLIHPDRGFFILEVTDG